MIRKSHFYLYSLLIIAMISCRDNYVILDDNLLGSVSTTQEEIWLDSLCSKTFAGRRVGTPGHNLAYEYLISEVKSIGYSPESVEWVHESGVVLRNIIVPIDGVVKDSIVIVGAHYDGQYESDDVTVFQAANDNGSGVVTSLSILDSLSNMEYLPRYTTYVCFWDGEEACISPAFKGSSYFVKHFESIGSIVLYVNIDAMGHSHDNSLLLGWYGGGTHSRVSCLVDKLIEERGFNYTLVERNKGEGGSDYVSFSRAGIPYISYTDININCENPIHSTRDTKDVIDYNRLRSVRDLTINVLMNYL